MRNKLSPRYAKEKVVDNKKIKVLTSRRRYHKQNLKRPPVNKPKLLQVPADGISNPSGSNDNQP